MKRADQAEKDRKDSANIRIWKIVIIVKNLILMFLIVMMSISKNSKQMSNKF